MKVNKEINLVQLDQELNGKGLNATLNDNGQIIEVFLTADNDATENQLKAAIDNHVATFQLPTIAEKLASIGLDIDELKAALV